MKDKVYLERTPHISKSYGLLVHFSNVLYILCSEETILPGFGGQVHHLLQNLFAEVIVLLVARLGPLCCNPIM